MSIVGPNIPLNEVVFTRSDIQIGTTVENPLAHGDNMFDTMWCLFAPALRGKGRSEALFTFQASENRLCVSMQTFFSVAMTLLFYLF